MAEFAVIGMGRFGRAVASNLARLGQSVLAVDHDRERLDRVADEVDSVAVADVTDEPSVAALELDRMAAVVVTIGSRATEASLLATAILRDLGSTHIVARCFDERHARLLLAVGANEVLNPEDEMGHRLAVHLAHPTILDQFAYGDVAIAEVEAPEAFAGRTLAELELRTRFGVSVLSIRRGETTDANPAPDAPVESGDVLVLLGHEEAIAGVAERK